MTGAERRAALDAVAAEVAACKRCRLHEGRTNAVPGEGNADTEVVFVGEGPGFHEDRLGRPFVGQAGALLDKLLASVCWKRDEVFIANVVKCRPPDNRDPEPEEIAACAPYLIRQLEILDPALVVTLGRFSMARFNPGAKISQVHGTFRPAHADSGAPGAVAFFMYHPAAALRSSQVETQCYADMKGVPDALTAARTMRAAGPVEPAETEAPASPDSDIDTAPVETAEPAEPAEPAAEEAAQSDPTSQLSLF